jgi:putative pyruvate formate lyase activating enzyme
LVYNSGGYDSVGTLGILDGVIDIYMPDMKYGDAEIAGELSDVENYPEINRAAVKEMHRQTGDNSPPCFTSWVSRNKEYNEFSQQ